MAKISAKTPRDLLRVVFRRPALFLVTAPLVAIAILLGSHWMPLQYTGTTVFERRVDPAAEELTKVKATGFASQKLTLQNQLIGHEAMQYVIDELRLAKVVEDGTSQKAKMAQMERQALEATLAANLKIDWRISSEEIDTVSLSFTSRDPQLAQKVPNLLVQHYYNSSSEEIKSRLKLSCDFLEQRVGESQKSLDKASSDRLAFQARNAQKYPEPGAFQQRINQLTMELQQLRPQLDLAKQKEAQLLVLTRTASQPATTSAPTSGPVQEIWGPNPEIARLQEEQAKARTDLQDCLMLRGMKEKHRDVIALRKKIKDLDTRLATLPPQVKLQEVHAGAGAGGTSLELAFQQAAVKSEIALLTGRVDQVQGELDHMQKSVAEYAKVADEYAGFVKTEAERQEDVKRYQTRLADLKMQLGAEVAQRATQSRTIQPAARQYLPSSPQLWMVLMSAVFGGLAAGGGLVFLANFFDRTLGNSQDASEYLGVPVHGVISEIVTQQQLRQRRRRALMLYPLCGIVLGAGLLMSLYFAKLRLTDQEKYQRFQQNPTSFLLHWGQSEAKR